MSGNVNGVNGASRSEAHVVGLSSPNARTAQIKRFCATPPPRAMYLRLVTSEDPPQPLGEWLAAQCRDNGMVCLEVDQLLVDHTETVGRPVEAILGWQTEGDPGSVISTKTLKCRPAPKDMTMEAFAAEQLGIDGTPRGQALQIQRHHEILLKSYLVAHQAQIGTSNQLVERSQERLFDLQDRYDELRRERDALVDKVRELSNGLPEGMVDDLVEEVVEASANGPRTDEAKAELYKTVNDALSKALPMAFAQLLAYAKNRAGNAGT